MRRMQKKNVETKDAAFPFWVFTLRALSGGAYCLLYYFLALASTMRHRHARNHHPLRIWKRERGCGCRAIFKRWRRHIHISISTIVNALAHLCTNMHVSGFRRFRLAEQSRENVERCAPKSFRTSENWPSFIIEQTFQVNHYWMCTHEMQKVLARLRALCACGHKISSRAATAASQTEN